MAPGAEDTRWGSPARRPRQAMAEPEILSRGRPSKHCWYLILS
jgi:hypothetical protein